MRWRATRRATLVVAIAMAIGGTILVIGLSERLETVARSEATEEGHAIVRQLRRGVPPMKLAATRSGLTLVMDDRRREIVLVTPGGPQRVRSDDVFAQAPWLARYSSFLSSHMIVEVGARRYEVMSAESRALIDRIVAGVRRGVFWGGLSITLFVGLLTWWTVGRSLRPVTQMRRAAEDISSSSLDRRVPEPRARDEVGMLARTFNRMLDRLQHASQRQREFVADASHELRTPVATIRTQLEVALSDDQADWPTVATSALEENKRLEVLIDELLNMARLEENGRHAQQVDLDDVALEEAARVPSRGVITTGIRAARVSGDRTRLGLAVGNLLRNAARHAREQVAVATWIVGDTAYVTVEDDGPGVPIEERDRIFNRFARGDEGRARDAGGAGLGLAVVRRVAEFHGGRAYVEDSSLGGARFVLELPVERIDRAGYPGTAPYAEADVR